MPGPLIEAATKVTKEQWRNILRRIMKKEGSSQLTPKAAEQIFAAGEPPIERTLGTLYAPHSNPSLAEEGVRQPLHMPIEEARQKYFQNPEGFTPGGARPPVKEISQVAPGSSEDLAYGISYARNKFLPVVPPSVARGASTIQRGEVADLAEQRLAGQGLSQEDIRVSPQQFLKQQGEKGQEVQGLQDLKSILKNANIADQIWREMNMENRAAGKLWGKMLNEQRTGVKNTFKSGKDWFVASFNKYQLNKAEFAKKHPKEASMIEKIQKLYEEGE